MYLLLSRRALTVNGLRASVHTQSVVVVTSDVLNGVWIVNHVANIVVIYIRRM